MLKYFFPVFLLGISFCAQSQTNSISVIDSNRATILFIQNENIIDAADNSIIYTVKGNLIFSGNSEKNDDILFKLNAPDIFSKKATQLITHKDNKPILTTSRANIYLGANDYRKELLTGQYEKTDSSFVFKREEKAKPLFEIKNNKLSSAQLMAIATIFIAKYKIDQALLDSLSARAAEQQTPSGTGTMRRLWSSGGNEDFVWDGYILKNRWSFNDFEQWSFDGETLKRAYYDTGEDFVWNGKTLQRKFVANGEMFELEGNTIRKVYGSAEDEFYIQGNIVKRAWTTIGSDEWEVNGELPVPIIMLIVYRIAR
jgi:hypothetical protein